MTRRAAPRALVAALGVLASLLTALAVAPGAQADERIASGCPAVAVFAVAGTKETDANADPGRSVGLLAGVTDPLAARYGGAVSVEYVPYPASYELPIPYPLSEHRGADRLIRDASDLAGRCPRTAIVLLGFSQGADVVSDVLHRAANHSIPLPPERISAAYMLGSPRRDPAAPNLTAVGGHGVLGARPTRELDVYGGRAVDVCAPGDPICSTDTLDVRVFQQEWASGAHRTYPGLLVGPAGTPLFGVIQNVVDGLVAGRPATASSVAGA